LNDDYLQQVAELEKQARAVYDAAVEEAKQLPVKAEADARVLLEKARADAEAQAKKLLAEAQSKSESESILRQTRQETERMKTLAMNHFNRAVGFVLDQLTGREQEWG
jgi:vacuolar-type H+-ATPase subunit H